MSITCHHYQLLVKHAYSECQADGMWHVVTDAFYTCTDPPGGVFGPRRVGDIPTEQPCVEGVTPPPILDLLDLVLPSFGSDPCRSARKLEETITVLLCVNGLWERHVYQIYECLDGSRRRLRISTEATNIDCETPLGPFYFRGLVTPLPDGFDPDHPRLKRLPSEDVRLGFTPIGNVYTITLDLLPRLVGVLDSASKTAYVAEDQSEKAREIFNVKEASAGLWVVDYPDSSTPYKLLPLEISILKQPISINQAFALRGRRCQPVAKGECLDFYDANGNFVYSWKAVRDTEMCFFANDYCVETWQQNQVTLFPLPDCKGTSYQDTKTWAFCVST